MTDVFISYSRKDKDFVQVLHQALTESKYDAWIDWQDIPLTADWWAEIEAGIEAADTFVFVISPDSVESKVCGQEIDHAVANHKRLVPIVRREGFDGALIHPELSKHNWLFFREQDNFDAAFAALVQVLNTDLAHVKEHTRLLVKATEWDKKSRRVDLLLRGQELEEVIQWLTQNADKEPRSTSLQREYINASRLALLAQQKAEMERQAVIRQRITRALIAAVGGLVVAATLGFTTFQQYRRAEFQRQAAAIGEVQAQITSANALLDTEHPFDALLETLKAVSNLQNVAQPDPSLTAQIKAVLHRAIFSVRERNRIEGHDSYWATSVSFSPQGDRIASGGMDGTVKLWTLDGQLLQTLSSHGAGIYDLSFSPDGQSLASASYDGTVKLWSLDGQLLNTWSGHEQRVTSVRFSPDGRTLASASDDRTIQLVDLELNRVTSLKGHSAGIHALDWSPDGKQLVSMDYDGHLKLWSRNGEELSSGQATAKVNTLVPRVSFSPSGTSILTTEADAKLSTWSPSLERQQTLQGPGYLISSLEYSPDGQMVAIAGEGNSLTGGSSIQLQDLKGNTLGELRGHVARINDLSFSPDGQTLASAAFDGTIRLWSLDPKQPKRLIGHTGEVRSVEFSSDGTKLASTGEDGTIRVWDISGRQLHQLTHSDYGQASEVSFSPDGQWLAVGYGDGTVFLQDLINGTAKSHAVHQKAVRSIDFSSGNTLFISSSEDGMIKVVNLKGEVVKELGQQGQDIYLVRFSPDEKVVAMAFNRDSSSKVAFWQWQLGEVDTSPQLVGGFGGGSRLTDMVFSNDGSKLGTSSWEGVIHLWNLQAQVTASFFAGNDGPVRTLSFSPDGQMLAASSGGYVRLWTLEGGEIQRLYDAKRVRDINFSPDSNIIAAANADGTITLFNLKLDDLTSEGCGLLASYLRRHPAVSDDIDVCGP